MWKDLDRGFQAAFCMAWEAYRAGTIPIGAAITDASGEVIATGRNQIFAVGEGALSLNNLAHAEMNAILALGERKNHPDVRNYVLYTTMEPCPMCFGAAVMANFRRIKYAARDGWAGAVCLNESLEYAKSKNIRIDGSFHEMEAVTIAINICHDIETRPDSKYGILSQAWAAYCPHGVEAGRRFSETGELKRLSEKGAEINEVYDFINNIITKGA